MNRHFSKTFATQDSHIHQTTIRFTYTSNHHKLHICIKPKRHIYNKPKLIKASIWVINGTKEFGSGYTYFNMKQNRYNAKYRWINGRNEVGRRRKPNRPRVRSVDLV